MRKVRVRLKERSYDILIGPGLLKKAGALFRRLNIGTHALILTNKRLFKLYGKALERSLKDSGIIPRFEIIPDSETAKSNRVSSRIIDRISAYDKKKRIFIIAFGGGVTGDLAGFVAAVYKRGIPYVQIPTTLLAQVDSAIGGKVGIDLPRAKNLVGAFYQPRVVLSDTSLIKTLPARQVKNALAEIIKYGVIKDEGLFKFLEDRYEDILALKEKALKHVIVESSRIKADIVSRDEFDRKGLRAVLNYGHTFGHAIETASGYSKRFYHGEAVAIGMVIAADISKSLGLLKAGAADRIEALIRKTGLPARIVGLKIADIRESHLHDKKFIHGKNRFILPVRIGGVRIVEGVSGRVISDAVRHRIK